VISQSGTFDGHRVRLIRRIDGGSKRSCSGMRFHEFPTARLRSYNSELSMLEGKELGLVLKSVSFAAWKHGYQ